VARIVILADRLASDFAERVHPRPPSYDRLIVVAAHRMGAELARQAKRVERGADLRRLGHDIARQHELIDRRVEVQLVEQRAQRVDHPVHVADDDEPTGRPRVEGEICVPEVAPVVGLLGYVDEIGVVEQLRIQPILGFELEEGRRVVRVRARHVLRDRHRARPTPRYARRPDPAHLRPPIRAHRPARVADRAERRPARDDDEGEQCA